MRNSSDLELEKILVGGLLIKPELVSRLDLGLISEPLLRRIAVDVRQIVDRGGGLKEVTVDILAKYADKQAVLNEIEDTWLGDHEWEYARRQLEKLRLRDNFAQELLRRAEELKNVNDPNEVALAIELTSAKVAEYEAEAHEDLFPPISYSTLIDYDPRQEVEYILGDGWLRRGAMTLLTGETGMGKSVFVTQLGMFVSAGRDFCGMKCRQKYRVLLVQAENDMDVLKRDVISIAERFSLSKEDLERFTIRWAHSVAGKSFHEHLQCWLMAKPPDLLIVDNYQAFFGGKDINSAGEWQDWFAPLISMCRRYQTALLLVDHTPKPKNLPTKDEMKTLRHGVYAGAGTSAKANAARAAAELCSLPDEEDRFLLRFSKNAERTGLCTASDPPRVVRKLYIEHSGNPHKPFWILSMNQEEEPTELQQRIQEALADNVGLSAAKLAEIVGCDRSTIYRYAKKKGISIR